MKLKKISAVLLMVSLVISSMVACGSTEVSTSADASTSETVESVSEEVSETEEVVEEAFEPIVHENLYTQEFSITEMEDGIQIVTDGDDRELVLVPKELAEVPEAYADSIVIRTPVEKAVFLSSTQACSLRTLGDDSIYDHIAGVNGDASTWGDIPGIQERVADGRIADLAGDMGEPNYEVLAALEPDVVFVYTGQYPQTSVIENLDVFGINYAVDNEYMESDYMGRMEWEKFVLSFFGETEAGAQAMLEAKETVESIQSTIAGAEAPKVIFASEFGGTINVTNPGSWLGNMIVDAGGDYVFADLAVEGLSMSMEDFMVEAQTADIIMYTSTPMWMPSQSVLFEAMPLLAEVSAVQNGKLYQYTDAFWMGIDESDVMIEDLAAVFYPELYDGRELTYFTEVPAE